MCVYVLNPHRYGIRGLVIDPYNELDHARPSYMQETEYVSSMLSKVRGNGRSVFRTSCQGSDPDRDFST